MEVGNKTQEEVDGLVTKLRDQSRKIPMFTGKKNNHLEINYIIKQLTERESREPLSLFDEYDWRCELDLLIYRWSYGRYTDNYILARYNGLI